MLSEGYGGELCKSQEFLSCINGSEGLGNVEDDKKRWSSKISQNQWKCLKSAESGAFR
jgi:hypothetical protein